MMILVMMILHMKRSPMGQITAFQAELRSHLNELKLCSQLQDEMLMPHVFGDYIAFSNLDKIVKTKSYLFMMVEWHQIQL